MVRAADDPIEEPVDGRASTGVSQRIVGVVFHETADRAVEQGAETAREDVRERLRAAEASSYGAYTAGDHCQRCPHRNLACSAGVSGDG